MFVEGDLVGDSTAEFSVPLSAGSHLVQLIHVNWQGSAYLTLNWDAGSAASMQAIPW